MKFMPVVIGVLLAWVMVICTQTALAEDIVERTVEISDVNSLHIEGDGVLEVRIGAEPSLTMTGLKSQLDKMTVDAKGTTLRVRKKGRWWSSESFKINYQVTLKTLEGLNVNGGMAVNVLSPIQADNFEFNLNGGGEVNFLAMAVEHRLVLKLNGGSELNIPQLKAGELEVKANGAAEITLAGQVHKQILKFNGASEYRAYGLESNVVDIRSSGASEAKLWVKEKLELHLNGAGEIKYYGAPEVHSQIAGVGGVERKGDVPPQ
jgi:hypothetical protein